MRILNEAKCMKKFIIRFISGLVLLFFISLVSFFLFKALPGDAYADRIYQSYLSGGSRANVELQWNDYVKENALDKPLFGISIRPAYIDKRAAEIPLNSRYREYAGAARYYQPCDAFYDFWQRIEKAELPESEKAGLREKLASGEEPTEIIALVSGIDAEIDEKLLEGLKELEVSKARMPVPVFQYNGTDNQFHFWLMQLLSGKLISEKLNQPVFSTIWKALVWTLSINIPAFLMLFVGGALLGGFRSLRDNAIVRILEKILYSFYSMPLFWLSTLALTIAVNWLPQGSFRILVGPFQYEDVHFLSIYKNHFASIYLPILCIFLHSTIYISRHVEQSVDSVKNSRYVLAAKARGLTDRLLLRRHIIPNSIRPVITLIPQLLPGLVAGSVIVETIFNIPGMGRLFWDSLMNRDWQMIFGLVIFISIVVYLSMWVADALYPRTEKVDAYD